MSRYMIKRTRKIPYNESVRDYGRDRDKAPQDFLFECDFEDEDDSD